MMSYKNKLGNIQENTGIKGVSFNRIILYAGELATFIKDIDKTLLELKPKDQSPDELEDVADLTTESIENAKEYQKLKEIRQGMLKNLVVLRYLGDWYRSIASLKSSKQFKQLVGTYKSFGQKVKDNIKSLGMLFREEQSRKPKATIEDLETIWNNISQDEGEEAANQFLKAIQTSSNVVPSYALKYILDNSRIDGIAEIPIYDVLVNKPETIKQVLRKTITSVSSFRMKAYRKSTVSKKVSDAQAQAQAIPALDIDQNDAEILSILAAFENKGGPKNETKDTGVAKILNKAYIEKIYSLGGLTEEQYNRALEMAANAEMRKQYDKFYNISNTKNKKEREAAIEKASILQIDSVEDVYRADGKPFNQTTMETILDFLNKNVGKFTMPSKDAPIEKFVAQRNILTPENDEIQSIKPKLQGEPGEYGWFVKKYEAGRKTVISVRDDYVVPSTEKSTEKTAEKQKYSNSSITISEPNDQEILDRFFAFVQKKISQLEEALGSDMYDAIASRTGNRLSQKVLSRIIKEYLFDLDDDDEENRLKQIFKDQPKSVAKYIIQLHNNPTQTAPGTEQDDGNKKTDQEADQVQGDEETDSRPEPSEEYKAAMEKIKPISDDLSTPSSDPWYYEDERLYGIIGFPDEGMFGIQVTKEYKPDDLIKLKPKGIINAIDSKEITQTAPDAAAPDDTTADEDEKRKAIEKVNEISDDIKAGTPWVLIQKDENGKKFEAEITKIEYNERASNVNMSWKRGTGTSGSSTNYLDWMQVVADGLITKKAEEQESPTPEEADREIDDTQDAIDDASGQANPEQEAIIDDAQQDLDAANAANEEAEELENQGNDSEAENKRKERDDKLQSAKGNVEKVIPLRQEPEVDSEIKEYIAAARKIADRFENLKRRGDDKIADDIEGFLEIYDSGNPDEKEEAFDLIDPIEEGKAGSVLDSIKSTIRKKKTPIPSNVYDNIKKQYEKLRAKLKELSKTAKNEKENFINHARAFLRYYKIINDFPKFVENTLKTKKKAPPKSGDEKLRAAENIERLLLPLVREVVRRKWQKRIT